jgi:hypothetical protein
MTENGRSEHPQDPAEGADFDEQNTEAEQNTGDERRGEEPTDNHPQEPAEGGPGD